MINLDIDIEAKKLRDETPKWIDGNHLYPSAFQGMLRKLFPFLLMETNLTREEVLNLPISMIDMFIGFYKKDLPASGIEYDRMIALYDQKKKEMKKFKSDMQRIRNF